MKVCPKCAAEVPDKAKVCQFCRHKFSVFQGGELGCGGMSAIIIAIALMGTWISGSKTSPAGNGLAPVQAGSVDQAALDDLVKEGMWSYNKSGDQISGGSITSASVTSINTVDFAAPYDGGSSLEIYLRKHPRSGTDVIVSISKGQIVCDVSGGCPVHVRFDEGKAKTFTGWIPRDYSSTALFLKPSAAMITALQKSKKVVVEVDFYREGGQQFTFNTANLHWPPRQQDFAK